MRDAQQTSEQPKLMKDLQEAISKVPEVTVWFWIIKIFATTLGEVGGNAVTIEMGLGYFVGILIFAVPLMILIAAQIKAGGFHKFLYWGTITLTTLAGTALADFATRSIGLGYPGGSLILFGLLMASLGLWYWTLGSVDIETVIEAKAELFYWATIMFSQTLGTALGDWMADGGLGYNGSAALIFGILVVLALLYFFTKVSHTFLFWAAFILTRPLGATLANSFDKPVEQGGLAISDLTMTGVLAVLMVILVFVVPQRSGRH